MPHDLILLPNQFQMGSFLGGSGTAFDLVKFTLHPAIRVYKAPVPGGGNYVPRVEADELGIILDLDVEGASASALATNWDALVAAFAPALDADFAWRLADAAIKYASAHVETPPLLIHDYQSNAGFLRHCVIGLVASNPTISTV